MRMKFLNKRTGMLKAKLVRVYSLGVFACVALIQRQDDLAEIDCIWVLCFVTSGYYGESIAE